MIRSRNYFDNVTIQEDPVTGAAFVAAGPPPTIGAPVIGGTPPSVLFIDPLGKLGQDPTHFGYNPITHTETTAVVDQTHPMRSIAPQTAGGVAWYEVYREFPSLLPIPNPVRRIGFNVAIGGGLVDTTHGAVAVEWEGQTSDEGVYAQELHHAFYGIHGAARRGLSHRWDYDAETLETFVTGNEISFSDQIGSEIARMTSAGMRFPNLSTMRISGDDSNPAERSLLHFNVNVLELGDPNNNLHILNNDVTIAGPVHMAAGLDLGAGFSFHMPGLFTVDPGTAILTADLTVQTGFACKVMDTLLVGPGFPFRVNSVGDTIVNQFGANGQPAQPAVAAAPLAGYVSGIFGLDSDVRMHALFDLVMLIRQTLVSNGILS
jgi:hypothetical protein